MIKESKKKNYYKIYKTKIIIESNIVFILEFIESNIFWFIY